MWEKIQNYCETFRSEDLNYLAREPYLFLGIAALGLLILWLLYRIRPRRKIKAFKGDTGAVEISKHALLELVRSACEQMPEVRKPSIRIRPRRKLNLAVRIRVDGSARLRDTASFLQNHIKDALENNLGVENLGKIEVMVTGIRTTAPKTVDLNQRGEKPAESAQEKTSPPASKPAVAPTRENPAGPAAPSTPPSPGSKPSPEAVKPPVSPASPDKPSAPKPSPGRPDLNPSGRKDPSAPKKPEKKEPKK